MPDADTLVTHMSEHIGDTLTFSAAMEFLGVSDRTMLELEKQVNSTSPFMLIRVGRTLVISPAFPRRRGPPGSEFIITREVTIGKFRGAAVTETRREIVSLAEMVRDYDLFVRRETTRIVSLRKLDPKTGRRVLVRVGPGRRDWREVYEEREVKEVHHVPYSLTDVTAFIRAVDDQVVVRLRDGTIVTGTVRPKGQFRAEPLRFAAAKVPEPEKPVEAYRPIWFIGRKFPDEDAEGAMRRINGYYMPPKCILEPEHEDCIKVASGQVLTEEEAIDMPFYTKREGIIGWFSRSGKEEYDNYYNISLYQTMPLRMPSDPDQFDFFWQGMAIVLRKMSESSEATKQDAPAYSLARILGGHGLGGPFPGWHKAEWDDVVENSAGSPIGEKVDIVTQGQGRACNFFVARYGDGPTGAVKPDGEWKQYTRGAEKYGGSLADDPDYRRLCSKSDVIMGW